MIVGVINGSGNVGKTTIARYLLVPKLANATLIPIESVNAVASGIHTAIEGEEWELLEHTLVSLGAKGDVVVDIGSSNLKPFWANMVTYQGVELFDGFVVPTTPNEK